MRYKFLLLCSFLVICASCQKNTPSATDPGGPTPTPAPTPSPTPAPEAALKVTVTTIGGQNGQSGSLDGNGANSLFLSPYKLAYDPRNGLLYVADQNQIRVIDAQNNVSTLLGHGVLNNFDEIYDIDVAPGAAGSIYFTTKYNTLYKIDGGNGSLRVLTSGEGNGDGPLSTNDHLQGAYGVASGADGDIAVYNTYWTALKRISAAGVVSAWAGKPTDRALGVSWPFADGQGTNATFSTHLYDICSDATGNVYASDKDNARIRKITPSGMVSSILPYASTDNDLLAARIKADGASYVAANQDGSYLYFTCDIGQYGNSASLIRLYRPGKSVVSIAGFGDGYADGAAKDALFGYITGLAVSPDGKTLYVSEKFNKTIRKITVE